MRIALKYATVIALFFQASAQADIVKFDKVTSIESSSNGYLRVYGIDERGSRINAKSLNTTCTKMALQASSNPDINKIQLEENDAFDMGKSYISINELSSFRSKLRKSIGASLEKYNKQFEYEYDVVEESYVTKITLWKKGSEELLIQLRDSDSNLRRLVDRDKLVKNLQGDLFKNLAVVLQRYEYTCTLTIQN